MYTLLYFYKGGKWSLSKKNSHQPSYLVTPELKFGYGLNSELIDTHVSL